MARNQAGLCDGDERPRFYFSMHVGPVVIEDEERTELPVAAKSEALLEARGLMSAAILEGDDISGRSIEIRTEAGEILFILPFADAVKRSS
jgi:hypothetical protein